ncbi:hypothetical protein [Nostoc sp.]|uniref:hypothetical protein n=1 Tax=Nostoc sp. TaxID=1180 RepID=UPI002FF09A1A
MVGSIQLGTISGKVALSQPSSPEKTPPVQKSGSQPAQSPGNNQTPASNLEKEATCKPDQYLSWLSPFFLVVFYFVIGIGVLWKMRDKSEWKLSDALSEKDVVLDEEQVKKLSKDKKTVNDYIRSIKSTEVITQEELDAIEQIQAKLSDALSEKGADFDQKQAEKQQAEKLSKDKKTVNDYTERIKNTKVITQEELDAILILAKEEPRLVASSSRLIAFIGSIFLAGVLFPSSFYIVWALFNCQPLKPLSDLGAYLTACGALFTPYIASKVSDILKPSFSGK